MVSTLTTRAYGSAERDAALLMAERLPGAHRVTLGADKGYDVHDFVSELRGMESKLTRSFWRIRTLLYRAPYPRKKSARLR